MADRKMPLRLISSDGWDCAAFWVSASDLCAVLDQAGFLIEDKHGTPRKGDHVTFVRHWPHKGMGLPFARRLSLPAYDLNPKGFAMAEKSRESGVRAEAAPGAITLPDKPMAALLGLADLGHGAALVTASETAALRIACEIADGKTPEECTALSDFLDKVSRYVDRHTNPDIWLRGTGHS